MCRRFIFPVLSPLLNLLSEWNLLFERPNTVLTTLYRNPHFKRKNIEYAQRCNKTLYCSLCGRIIYFKHWHECSECRCIVCDSCTQEIESKYNQKEHNLCGWVEHCKYITEFLIMKLRKKELLL